MPEHSANHSAYCTRHKDPKCAPPAAAGYIIQIPGILRRHAFGENCAGGIPAEGRLTELKSRHRGAAVSLGKAIKAATTRHFAHERFLVAFGGCHWRSCSGRNVSNHREGSRLAAGPFSATENRAMKNESINEFWGDRLISKREAAGVLGVSIRTVERAISSGAISCRKIRGCVRLLLSEVLLMAGIQ